MKATPGDLLLRPVGDGAVGVERCEAALDAVEQIGPPRHVEETLLLPGEARLGKILGRGAAAHRDAAALVGTEARVGLGDGLFKLGGQSGRAERRANGEAAALEIGGVRRVEAVQRPGD